MATPTVVVLTTLNAGTYTIDDLGAISFTHPVTYTLTDIFQPEELAASDDLIALIQTSNVSVTINGVAVPSTSPLTENTIRDMAGDDQDAGDTSYDNGTSGLTATTVQGAIDELDGVVDGLVSSSHAPVTIAVDGVSDDAASITAGQVLTLNPATPTTDGVLTAADKAKLDTVETNAAADQDADEVPYDNSGSGLTATDVQAAIDEIDTTVDGLVTNSHVPISKAGVPGDTTDDTLTLSGTDNQTVQVNLVTTTTDGAMSAADKTKLDGIATGANNYVHPNHSGDVTSVGDGAQTIALNAVDNTKAADMPALTLKGNDTGSAADPQDLTVTEVQTLLNVEDGANNYVHPNHSGDVTSVADGATTIQPNVVDNTKLADMATNTFKGRSAGAGDPQDLSVTQVKGILDYQADEVDVTPTGNLTSTDVQAALEELQTEIDALDSGYNRRTKVQGIVVDNTVDPTATAPFSTAATGDRYALSTTSTSGATGGAPNANWGAGAAEGDIVEFDGASWSVVESPLEGYVYYVDGPVTPGATIGNNQDALFVDDGTPAYELREVAVTNHNDLGGLQGGTTNEYYHLTNAEHQALTSAGGVANASTEHIHDDRYYTETELDGGQLDNRYYTETELSSNANGQGASLIGVEDAAGDFVATDVEGVLAELQTNIDNVAASAKMSWQYQTGRNANNLNLSQDLRNTNGIPTNVSPFIVPVACELTMASAVLGTSTGATASPVTIDVLRNGSVVATVTIPAGAVNKAATTGLTVAFAALDEVRIRYNYNTADAVDRPAATAYFREV